MRKVMVLAAHFDDVELSMGASIRKWTNNGIEVLVYIYKWRNGDKYEAAMMSEKILGHKHMTIGDWGERVDGKLETERDVVGWFDKEIQVQSPSYFITHWEEDYHSEHQFCHRIGMQVARKQPLDVWYMNSFPYCHRYKNFNANIYSAFDGFDFVDKKKALEQFDPWMQDGWIDGSIGMNAYHGSMIKNTRAVGAEVFSAHMINV